MIALLFGAGFVYAFALDGFNVETVPSTEVDAWLAVGNNYGKDCDNDGCVQSWAGCPGNGCTGCDKISSNCTQGPGKKACGHSHDKCGNTGHCPFNSGGGTGYCSKGGTTCPPGCNMK